MIFKAHLKIAPILFVIIGLLWSSASKAQSNGQGSDKGWMIASYVLGCSSFTVELTNNGNVSGSLFVDFEGNPNDLYNDQGFTDVFAAGETLSYTYSTPGTYLIRAVSQTGGTVQDRFDFINVHVIDPIEPIYTVSLCENNQVVLQFNTSADEYSFYEIDFGDGSAPQRLDKNGQNASNTITYSYSSQNNYSISIAGKLSGNVSDDTNCATATLDVNTIENIPTPMVNGLITTSETSLTIDYQPLDPNIRYDLEFNEGQGFQVLTAIDPAQNPTSLVIDYAFFNNLQNSYTFRIKASDPCNNNIELSNQLSSIVLNYQLTDINTTIDISFDWVTNELAGPASLIQGGNTLHQTTDLVGSHIESFTNCSGITSFYMEKSIGGAIARSITITPFVNQSLELPAPLPPAGVLSGNNIELTLAPPPFQYSEIEVFRKGAANSYTSLGTTNQLAFTDYNVSANLTTACYVVQYVDNCGNISLQSQETCIALNGLLRTPNAFSPNGDGINDTFSVGFGIFTDFEILIYNKWGILVYKGNDPENGWDGNFNDKEAPMGTYHYKISYQKSGLALVSTGTVTLIR